MMSTKSKSHNVRNGSWRFVSKKTLKQKLQALWMGFWCAVDGVSKRHVLVAVAALAVALWLVFVA